MDCTEVSWIFNQLILATRFQVPDYIVQFYNEMLLKAESCGSLRELQDAFRIKHNEILPKQTASQYINYLEQAGWVSGEPDPADKRRYIINPLIRDALPTFEAEFPSSFTSKTFEGWLRDLEGGVGPVVLEEADKDIPGTFLQAKDYSSINSARLGVFDGSDFKPPVLTSDSESIAELPEGQYLCPICGDIFIKSPGWQVRGIKHLRLSHPSEAVEGYEKEIREVQD